MYALKAKRNNRKCLDSKLFANKPCNRPPCSCSSECFSQLPSCYTLFSEPRRVSHSLPPHSSQHLPPCFVSVQKNSITNEKKRKNELFYKNIGTKDEACIMVSNDVNKLKKAFSDLGTAYMIDNSGPEEAVVKIVEIDKKFLNKDQKTEKVLKHLPNDEKNSGPASDTVETNLNQEKTANSSPENKEDSLPSGSNMTSKIENNHENQELENIEKEISNLPYKRVEVAYDSKTKNRRKVLIECEDTMKKILAGENFTVCRKQPCSTASCSSMIAEINSMAKVLQRKAGPQDWRQFHPDVQEKPHFTSKKLHKSPIVLNFNDKKKSYKKAEKRHQKKKNFRPVSLQAELQHQTLFQQNTLQPPYHSQQQQPPRPLLKAQNQLHQLAQQTLTPQQLNQHPFYNEKTQYQSKSFHPFYFSNSWGSFNAKPSSFQDFSQNPDVKKFRHQCDYIYKHLKKKRRDSSDDSSEEELYKSKTRKNRKRRKSVDKNFDEFDSLERLKTLARLHPIMPKKFKDFITTLPVVDSFLSNCNFALENSKNQMNYEFKSEMPKNNGSSKSEIPEYHMDPCVQSCIQKQNLNKPNENPQKQSSNKPNEDTPVKSKKCCFFRKKKFQAETTSK